MHRSRNARSILNLISVALFLLLIRMPSFAQPVRATHLTVELVTEPTSIAANRDFLAGLHFVLDKGWHIYWLNAGDAGKRGRAD